MVHYQIIHCSHCDGTDLQKNGKNLESTQRWFCKGRKRYFRLEYRYNMLYYIPMNLWFIASATPRTLYLFLSV